MNTLLNLSYLTAAVLFLGVVYVQTSRTPPPPHVRGGWPLRQFWVSARLRHLGLVLTALAALCGIAVALGTGIKGDGLPERQALLGFGSGLVLLGAVMLGYSILLYWQESAPKPDGF